jgi:hypothetical protein
MIQYLPNIKFICVAFQTGVTIIGKYDSASDKLKTYCMMPPLADIKEVGVSGNYIRFTEMPS